jgi:thiol-disulfide isomerase/thioredoxin
MVTTERTGRTERTVGTVRSVAIILALCVATVSAAAAQFDAGIPVGSKAPPLVINDLDGKPVDLGLIIGKKPVMLEFWATWCALCKGLLPQLDAVKKAYGDQVEMVGINVTVNDSKTRIKRYLEEHHPPFQVLYDDKGAGARAYDVPATSYIVVIDRSGKVVYTGSGADQDLVAAVKKGIGGG